jgi:hypothetical protein
LLIHDFGHLDFIKSIPEKPQKELSKMAERLDSIYINPDTFDCSLLSAGSLLAVVDAVCQVLLFLRFSEKLRDLIEYPK